MRSQEAAKSFPNKFEGACTYLVVVARCSSMLTSLQTNPNPGVCLPVRQGGSEREREAELDTYSYWRLWTPLLTGQITCQWTLLFVSVGGLYFDNKVTSPNPLGAAFGNLSKCLASLGDVPNYA